MTDDPVPRNAAQQDSQSIRQSAIDDPEAFWGQAASAVDWLSPYHTVLDQTDSPHNKWFIGGLTNTCHNALDRHVHRGQGDKPALIFESAMTGASRFYSYNDLLREVAIIAGALKRLGVDKGDRVVIYMPMIPEAVMSMLAVARIGAIHSVVFGGFADQELAKRIDDTEPKVILSASCGLEPGRVVAYKPLLDSAVAKARHKPEYIVVFQRPDLVAEIDPAQSETKQMAWEDFVRDADPAPCTKVASTDPLYILYTSGTTGIPKGVVRDNGGHMAALIWSMQNIYGASPDDVFWAASDIGWVVGHSYIVYAPLLYGATTVLYEGKPVGTPDAGAFWRLIDKHRVNILFTAPTAFRAIKGQDPDGRFIDQANLSSLRTLFLAGERADPDTIHWAQGKLQIPVIDHWWQTELGWPALATCLGLGEKDVLAGSAGRPVPGWNIQVVDSSGKELPRGETGEIVIRLPLPPGAFSTLWRNDQGYLKSYMKAYPGYYATGDAGFIDENGFVHVMSRTDDIINVAGHRLSTGAMEEVISAHPLIAECAVVGVVDQLKGQLPVGLIVLNAGVDDSDGEIVRDVIARVRAEIGPVAAFKLAAIVANLPKTRSGKILRATLRKLANGEDVTVPPTIDDPNSLTDARAILQSMGFTAGNIIAAD